MKRKYIFLVLSVALLFLAGVNPAKAEIITFYPDTVLGHGTAPEEEPPWISAIFDDHGDQGSVTLTLSCLNLSAGEFVSRWLFNLDPLLNPKDLEIEPLAHAGSFRDPSISLGANKFNGGGGDKFDIAFYFSTSNKNSKRFDADDSLQLEISGISDLTAQSFDFNSKGKDHCNNNDILHYKTEAHIQGIVIGHCGGDSGWVVVPEPSSFILLGMGAFGLAFCGLRRRYK